MTRKDYVRLAAALAWARPNEGKASQYKPAEQRARMAAWRITVECIATELKKDNERFDHVRFANACGYVFSDRPQPVEVS
jgi:hypothetical protein